MLFPTFQGTLTYVVRESFGPRDLLLVPAFSVIAKATYEKTFKSSIGNTIRINSNGL
jgi:hypothetical protein